MSSSLVGKTLGNYKIVDSLGQGGMATVYLGYQETVDRRVAIKVLPPHPGLDRNFADRFQIEARTIARLEHPHILSLYDYGQQDDILYLVMAYADGGSLEDLIVDGRLDSQLVIDVLDDVAEALDYAHRQGVVHRDIKPGNILMDSEGHAMLADFGIVKLAESSGNLTGTGIVGTPTYMAPEQAQGGVIDGRADIYSLGVVVYQMLSGELPFNAQSLMQVMLKVMQEPPPNILTKVPDLPPAVAEVINRVLSKNPEDRYQTATDFAKQFKVAMNSNGESLAELVEKANIDTATRPYAAARATVPETPAATAVLENISTTGSGTFQTDTQNPGQTVIVHHNQNPIVLLGGFAIIAVALVAIVLLVLSNSGEGGTNRGDNEATAQAAVENLTAAADQTAQSVAVLPTAAPTFGRVSYSTRESLGDTVTISVDGLDPPGTGNTYQVWLVNTKNDDKLNLGALVLDPLGNGALSYTDDSILLAAKYNAAVLTVEEGEELVEEPSQDVPYSGAVPRAVSEALYEIFIASPDGIPSSSSSETTPDEYGYEDFDTAGEGLGSSLLESAIIEARNAENHSGLAARASTAGGMHTHAEHTINILRGEEEDYDGSGTGQNPGRGVGVYPLLDEMETRILDAVREENASFRLQTDAEFILVCINNTRERADRIIELEQELLASDTIEAVADQAQESTVLAENLTSGFDLNQNGQVEAFEGECGLQQIETFGILFGGIDILEGGIN